MNDVAIQNTQATSYSSNKSSDVWTERYKNEGQIWGNQPSPPARYLTRKILKNPSRIIEIGAGYGRDANWFAENGHHVTAIEKSPKALVAASDELTHKIDNGKIGFITQDFNQIALGQKSHDVFFSHRVLHLLGNNGVTESFARVASQVLKPEGTLLVTARTFSDFRDDQMVWESKNEGIARYRDDLPEEFGDRRGQTLYFWNEAKLRDLFDEHFTGLTFMEDEEIESINNKNSDGQPVMTRYISILAKRRYTPNGNGH